MHGHSHRPQNVVRKRCVIIMRYVIRFFPCFCCYLQSNDTYVPRRSLHTIILLYYYVTAVSQLQRTLTLHVRLHVRVWTVLSWYIISLLFGCGLRYLGISYLNVWVWTALSWYIISLLFGCVLRCLGISYLCCLDVDCAVLVYHIFAVWVWIALSWYIISLLFGCGLRCLGISYICCLGVDCAILVYHILMFECGLRYLGISYLCCLGVDCTIMVYPIFAVWVWTALSWYIISLLFEYMHHHDVMGAGGKKL